MIYIAYVPILDETLSGFYVQEYSKTRIHIPVAG